ncbi:MAG: magnesium/cobalt transporter CorA [Chitinophagaceae bacterium]|nr:magnesium/cobalt transporter CorA [Chitinophagaceae bacterium]
MTIKPEKYIKRILGVERTKKILSVNPTVPPVREEAREVSIFVHDYNADTHHEYELKRIDECLYYKNNGKVTWINIDGLRKADVEKICNHFDIHYLIMEDILSINQRPKMDEINSIIYCLLNMLYYNNDTTTVEQEQISIILGEDYVLTFQEDPKRDVFNPLRERLKIPNSKIRQNGPDFLLYTLLDLIVDNYYLVMEDLGTCIEQLEDDVIRVSNRHTLERINKLRKELIVLRRNIAPVRDLINGILRSDSDLLQERNMKYFKDVYDHIVQAHDLTENYRDVLMNIQDLYFGNVNLKMNQVMKVMAIVTCLLAPPTVIVGIFGMNFDIIPFAHTQEGFYITVFLTLVIPIIMLYIFKRRGWF